MSALDRAFIRAYSGHVPLQVPASDEAPRTADAHRSSPAPADDADDFVSVEIVEPVADELRAAPSQTRATVPLSAYSGLHVDHESFRPMLAVEKLAWPKACDELVEQAGQPWHAFIDAMIERVARGAKRMLVTSVRRGEGRTTLVLVLARQLARRALSGVAIDADFENAMLARQCGISAPVGWGEVLQNNLPLGEALIAANEDGVTLMPWRSGGLDLRQATSHLQAAHGFSMLANHFDFMLVDAMPLAAAGSTEALARFAASLRAEGVYLVRDVHRTTDVEINTACRALVDARLPVVGIIENFVTPSNSLPASRAQAAPADAGRLAVVSR